MLAVDGPLTIQRLAQRVDDPADQLGADRNRQHLARAAHRIPFLEHQIVAEHDGADVVLFEVGGQRDDGLAGLARFDLEHLVVHRGAETPNASHTIADLEDLTDLLRVELVLVALDLSYQRLLDLAGAELRSFNHRFLSRFSGPPTSSNCGAASEAGGGSSRP